MKFAHAAVRAALLSTISVASIGLASAAQAQDETVEATDAAAEEDVAFDEIIVTATRRDQAARCRRHSRHPAARPFAEDHHRPVFGHGCRPDHSRYRYCG